MSTGVVVEVVVAQRTAGTPLPCVVARHVALARQADLARLQVVAAHGAADIPCVCDALLLPASPCPLTLSCHAAPLQLHGDVLVGQIHGQAGKAQPCCCCSCGDAQGHDADACSPHARGVALVLELGWSREQLAAVGKPAILCKRGQ